MQEKLNTCQNSTFQYTRRRSVGDYVQHYLSYRLYPIKQTFYLEELQIWQGHLTTELK